MTGGWVHKTGRHGVLFPLAVYETVNFLLQDSEALLRKIFAFSYNHRGLFWTPFLGIVLLIMVMRTGWRARDHAALLVSVPALLQFFRFQLLVSTGIYCRSSLCSSHLNPPLPRRIVTCCRPGVASSCARNAPAYLVKDAAKTGRPCWLFTTFPRIRTNCWCRRCGTAPRPRIGSSCAAGPTRLSPSPRVTCTATTRKKG